MTLLDWRAKYHGALDDLTLYGVRFVEAHRAGLVKVFHNRCEYDFYPVKGSWRKCGKGNHVWKNGLQNLLQELGVIPKDSHSITNAEKEKHNGD